MASINQQNTRHANRCRIVIDGTVLAEGTSIQVTENANPQPVAVVGSEYAQEHVYTLYNANATIAALHWRRQNLRRLSAAGDEMVTIHEFDVQALDEVDNRVLWVIRRCTFASRGSTISANQPIQRNVQIVGIRIDDGAGSGGRNAPRDTRV